MNELSMTIEGEPYKIDLVRSDGQDVSLSLIVPTRNEAKNIGPLLIELCRILDEELSEKYEIIVVDDNSPDRTGVIVERLLPQCARVKLARRTHEQGLASAVVRGWQLSRGRFMGVMDGDLQHPPETMRQLIAVMKTMPDVDLIVASRYVGGGGVSDWKWYRRIISRTAQYVGFVAIPRTIRRVSDPMSGYFLVRREAIAGCVLKPIGYKILLDVLARGKIGRIEEVGYVFQERVVGRSKVGPRVYGEYLLQLMTLCFHGLRKGNNGPK